MLNAKWILCRDDKRLPSHQIYGDFGLQRLLIVTDFDVDYFKGASGNYKIIFAVYYVCAVTMADQSISWEVTDQQLN